MRVQRVGCEITLAGPGRRLGVRAADREPRGLFVDDANPLDNIMNTRRIDRVYVRGQAIDRAALKASWSTTGGSE